MAEKDTAKVKKSSTAGGDEEETDEEAGPVDVQKFLKGMEYPATKDELVDQAKQNSAPDEVLDILDLLPDEVDYNGPAVVTREIGNLDAGE